jgi:subtilisin family serine protease
VSLRTRSAGDNGAGGCGANTGDSVAAIDQAVADGVDVINYSISGTSTDYLDAVEVAYLFAADAGVFVAASAGNSGPTASTVAHISPWLASVAAGTHDRSGTGTVTLGNGAQHQGASLTPAVGSSPLISATDAGVAGAHPDLVRQCFSANPLDGKPVLDPAKVAGKIVVCQRGGASPVPANARVDKSAAVKAAGGVGMILFNVAANSLNADLHSISTVHVDHVVGPTIDAYAKTAGATAALSQATVTRAAPAPDTASFSSRGPSRAGGGDILKPDFMLPGQDILASVAPPGNAGKDFDIYSGTSMSSPHVAGAAALLTQAHPDWSPAAMRSAMATTASTALVLAYNPFNAGSGHVRPNLMVNPGLVYDAGFDDYLAFLKGQKLCCAATASIPALDASDLNQPSLAVGDLAGNTYRVGSLTWSDGTHSVRSPIVVRPVAIAASAELTLSGTSGATSYGIKTGYKTARSPTRSAA